MIDDNREGPTYYAVASQILDDIPGEVPEPHLRVIVDYDEESEMLAYTIESHHEDEYGERTWQDVDIIETLSFSDDIDEIDDFLAGTPEDSIREIPLMYNGAIIRNNLGDLDAFDDTIKVKASESDKYDVST